MSSEQTHTRMSFVMNSPWILPVSKPSQFRKLTPHQRALPCDLAPWAFRSELPDEYSGSSGKTKPSCVDDQIKKSIFSRQHYGRSMLVKQNEPYLHQSASRCLERACGHNERWIPFSARRGESQPALTQSNRSTKVCLWISFIRKQFQERDGVCCFDARSMRLAVVQQATLA